MRRILIALVLVQVACSSAEVAEPYTERGPERGSEHHSDHERRDHYGPSDERGVVLPIRMAKSEEIQCTNDRAAGTFIDLVPEADLDFVQVAEHPTLPLASGVYAGVAVADFDSDSELDLYFTNIGGPPGYFLTGGRGPLAWQKQPLALEMSAQFAAYPGDADNDGDLDLLFTPLHLHGGLISNDGSGNFSSDFWLPGPNSMTSTELTAAWFDADGDGRLDIVMAGGPERDHQGAFQDPNGSPERLLMWDRDIGYQATLLPSEPNGEAFAVAPADVDNDGDLDLYVVNDFGMMLQPNRLLLNDGKGAFEDVSSASGADVAVWGMGVAVGDVNNDGWLDLYASTMSPEHDRLMLNLGDGTFDDATFDWNASSIMVSQGVAWGPVFLDVENDGDLDLYVARGYHPGLMPHVDHNGPEQPNVLLLNKGDQFEHDGDVSGISTPAWSRTSVPVDLNRDGFMDLVVANIGGPPNIFMNGCDQSVHWVGVRLTTTPQPIGARITVEAAGQVFIRELGSGSEGLASGGPSELSIGLGQIDRIDVLRIRWSDGEIFEATDLETRRYYTIGRF